MKIIKIILVVLLILLVLAVLVFTYFGAFRKIEFKIVQEGGELLVYEEALGDYSKTPEITNRVYEALLNDFGVETFRGFGIFYDNPKDVNKDKLRSECGCIVDSPLNPEKISEIQKRFKVKNLEQGSYLKTEFPYKNAMSIMVGIMRVYPAISRYQEEIGLKQNEPIIEIYDVPNKKIVYLQKVTTK